MNTLIRTIDYYIVSNQLKLECRIFIIKYNQVIGYKITKKIDYYFFNDKKIKNTSKNESSR